MTKQLLQRALGNLMKLTDCDGPEAYGVILDEIEANLRTALSAEAIDTLPERVQKAMPQMIVGHVYQTHNHGPAVFEGIDVYHGESAYQFNAGGKRIYCLPHDYGFFEHPTAQPDAEAMRKELERVTKCLKKANDSTEEFERKWYLLGDEMDRVKGERDAMKLDAKRYLHLRDSGKWDCRSFLDISDFQTMDAAIDAAIAGQWEAKAWI